MTAEDIRHRYERRRRLLTRLLVSGSVAIGGAGLLAHHMASSSGAGGPSRNAARLSSTDSEAADTPYMRLRHLLQLGGNLVDELEKTAALGVRSYLEDDDAVFKSLQEEYADRMRAIQRILSEKPLPERLAVQSIFDGRRGLLENKQQDWEGMLRDVFIDSFADPARGKQLFEKSQQADPDFIYDQMVLAYQEILEAISVKQTKKTTAPAISP